MDAFFPHFFTRPRDIRFQEQEDDEVIELLMRRHWVTNVPWIFFAILGILAPFAILSALPIFYADFYSVVPPYLVIFGTVIWYILIFIYIVESFLSWYFNIYVVTNLHLLDVNFDNLLRREFVEVKIDDVESASSKMAGLFSSIFGYGNVVVRTAAEHHQITFDHVPYPDKVTDIINDFSRHQRSNYANN